MKELEPTGEATFAMIPANLACLVEHGHLDGLAIAVYFALRTFADNETGECYPSIASICKRSGVGRTAVKERLDMLKNVGVIRSEPRGNGRNGSTSNLYVLKMHNSQLIPAISKLEPWSSGDHPQQETEEEVATPSRVATTPSRVATTPQSSSDYPQSSDDHKLDSLTKLTELDSIDESKSNVPRVRVAHENGLPKQEISEMAAAAVQACIKELGGYKKLSPKRQDELFDKWIDPVEIELGIRQGEGLKTVAQEIVNLYAFAMARPELVDLDKCELEPRTFDRITDVPQLLLKSNGKPLVLNEVRAAERRYMERMRPKKPVEIPDEDSSNTEALIIDFIACAGWDQKKDHRKAANLVGKYLGRKFTREEVLNKARALKTELELAG